MHYVYVDQNGEIDWNTLGNILTARLLGEVRINCVSRWLITLLHNVIFLGLHRSCVLPMWIIDMSVRRLISRPTLTGSKSVQIETLLI